MNTRLIAATAALLMTSGWAAAQTATPADQRTTPERPAGAMSPAAPGPLTGNRASAVPDEKDKLEEMLKAGKSRADYAGILEKNGYRISSINVDKKDYLEYEVVKGDHSYEVKLDFKNGAPQASEIDVTSNLWRTDATKAMLKDPNYKMAAPLVADPSGKYSDSRYTKGWTDEKDKLEKALAPNMKLADYKSKIEQLGYKITSVNDREKDYVEYEIVKGDNSYEVQIDMNPKTMVATKVDIDHNLNDAPATDRAKKGAPVSSR